MAESGEDINQNPPMLQWNWYCKPNFKHSRRSKWTIEVYHILYSFHTKVLQESIVWKSEMGCKGDYQYIISV